MRFSLVFFVFLTMLSTFFGRKLFSRSSFRVFTHNSAPVQAPLVVGLKDSKVGSNSPVVVNAFVDKEIIAALQLQNNRKKCRLLISTKVQGEWSLSYLRRLIETKYPELTDQPYKLRYKSPSSYDSELKRFSGDEELKHTLQVFAASSSPLHLFIQVNPGVFPAGTSISVDPLESPTYTMVSFYAFSNITDPEALSQTLRSLWEPFRALGRIYIAEEGVNAQMAVPSNSFSDFVKATQSVSVFSKSRFNVDHEMSKEEFHSQQVFKNLHIRVREQIVADGLTGAALDWARSGTELSPLDWHASLDNPNAVILDCRNTYETDVGRFKGAIPLNTTFFRESWTALEEVLKDVPPSTPVLTYCTGGIRCVKINAYLEQKMGFNNTYRLKGGIISYAKTLESQAGGLKEEKEILETTPPPVTALPVPHDPQFQRDIKDSKFLGVNYVFDDRMGARVTADVFAQCESCGQPCDAFTNCLNFDCNVRFIQCSTCRVKTHNCCSLYCESDFVKSLATHKKKEKINRKASSGVAELDFEQQVRPVDGAVNAGMLSRKATRADGKSEVKKLHAQISGDMKLGEALAAYSESQSVVEPALLRELREDVNARYPPEVARMLSGPSQGALLSFLASAKKAKNVLELGSFVGYSTLCLASDFSKWDQGMHGDEHSARVVHSCEIDKDALEIAKSYVQRSPLGNKVVFHNVRAEQLIEWSRAEKKTYDIVFLDADKKQYKAYLQSMMGDGSGDSILNDQALIIVDNTLWKGLVLNKVESLKELAPQASDFGQEARMLKIADVMHEFNTFCASHVQLKPLLLPIRDGFTIIQYCK